MDDFDAGSGEPEVPRALDEHQSAPIFSLPVELLSLVFERFLPPENKTVDIHRRRFLSHESLPHEEHLNDHQLHDDQINDNQIREVRTRRLSTVGGSIEDICTLRLVCKLFAATGERLLFSRVVTRFSKSGLEKLKTLAGWPHLAAKVRKFSYLVPYLYVDGMQAAFLGKEKADQNQTRPNSERHYCRLFRTGTHDKIWMRPG
jgi:hypothetical protein